VCPESGEVSHESFASNWAESDYGSTMTSAADWPPRPRDWEGSFSKRWPRWSHPTLCWHRRLIAQKYDGSRQRGRGRPRKSEEIEDLVVRMAKENRSWGYR